MLTASNYDSERLRTYLTRNFRSVRNLDKFQRFLHACAHNIGQPINCTRLSYDVDVAVATVKSWLSVLESSLTIIRLPPYPETFGKRTIKSPKLYFRDIELATYLLGEKAEQPLLENFVLLELLNARHLYFFRDAMGHEVDFVFQSGHELIPIEIKASQTYSKQFLKGLRWFEGLVGKRCPRSFLIYTGEREQMIGPSQLLNYRHTARALEDHSPIE